MDQNLTNKLLASAVDYGIIDLDAIEIQIEKMKEKEYLEKHPFTIYQGNDKLWYTFVKDESNKYGRRRIKRKNKEDLEKYLINFYKDLEKQGPKITIDNLFYKWIEWKENKRNLSKSSVTRYKSAYNKYFSLMKDKAIKDITELELEDYILQAFKIYKLTADSWSDLRIILKGIYKYAFVRNYTDIDIDRFLSKLDLGRNMFTPKRKKETEDVFTEDEVIKMIKAIDDYPILSFLFVKLALQTGLRAGELAALKPEDIDYQNKIIHVKRREIRYKDQNNNYIYTVEEGLKGSIDSDGLLKVRDVYVNDQTIETLKEIRKLSSFSEWLCCQKNGERKKEHDLTIACHKVCKRANIPTRSIHKCRKTYASLLLNSGASEAFVKAQLGHADIKTTRSYYLRDSSSKEEKDNFLKVINF
ncbi:MAG: site-specific integrase [Lachnospiraceae bacterium]|nr:site-specific integrase [Lachnospiraceae bacterium]